MKASHLVLCLIDLLGIVAIPTAAQTLGERMDEEGTAWIIGEWTLSSSPPAMNVNTIKYEWDLDRRIVLMSMERQRDSYKYHGMMLFVPSKKELVGMGADSAGGTYRVSCRTKDTALIHSFVRTTADGSVGEVDMVCTKADGDTMKVDTFVITGEGDRRSSEPLTSGTYKREKALAEDK